MTRVLLTHRDESHLAREIDALVGERIEWTTLESPDVRTAEVWFCAGSPPPKPVDLPALRWIQSGWAGIENWFQRPEWRNGVALTRTVGDFPTRIAEYVFGYLLARELGVAEALRQMTERTWQRWTPETLAGRALLVVGYGAIGRQIGAVARSFRMSVEGIRRTSGRTEAGVHGLDALDACVGRADVIVNVLPLTPETESFWSRARFGRMREGAGFVNVSRGATVDEAALVDGLARGRPGFAILDVFRKEPLPPEHPLRGRRDVWVTPHVAGIGTARPLAAEFAENWRRFREGLPLRHLVDRSRGY